MEKLIELKQARAKIVEEQRAIYDKADAEKRMLTAVERQKYEKLDQDFDALSAEIKELEADIERRNQLKNRQDSRGEGGDGDPRFRMNPGDFRERGFKLFKPEERAAAPSTPGCSLGGFIVGVATGKWKSGELRAMSEGTDTAGGHLVPTPLSDQVIDLLRPHSVLVKAGALRTTVENGSLKMPRVTTDPTVYWRAESAAITESDPVFDAVTLEPKACAALIRVSLELLQDSPNAEQVVENLLLAAIAAEVDRVGLVGSGSGSEPTGLFNDADVNVYSMGTNGAALSSYSPFSEAIQDCWENNAEPGAVIMAPRTAGVLDRLVDGDAQPMQPLPSFTKLKKLVTSAIPITQTQGTATNASCAIVGDFSNLVLGYSGENARVDVSTQADDVFGKMQALIRCYVRVDVGILRPTAFSVIKGIIPA